MFLWRQHVFHLGYQKQEEERGKDRGGNRVPWPKGLLFVLLTLNPLQSMPTYSFYVRKMCFTYAVSHFILSSQGWSDMDSTDKIHITLQLSRKPLRQASLSSKMETCGYHCIYSARVPSFPTLCYYRGSHLIKYEKYHHQAKSKGSVSFYTELYWNEILCPQKPFSLIAELGIYINLFVLVFYSSCQFSLLAVVGSYNHQKD